MSLRILVLIILATLPAARGETVVRENPPDEPLPPRALARLGSYRFYHGPEITCAALSPDGRCIASAARLPALDDEVSPKERLAYDPLIVLWDAGTGKRLRTLRTPLRDISGLAFSPDGQRIAAAGSSPREKAGIAVLEVATGKLLWQRADFERGTGILSFSTDGRRLHLSEPDGSVSFCEAATGKRRRRLPPPGVDRNGMSAGRGVLSPDGKVVAWHMSDQQVKKGPFVVRATAWQRLLHWQQHPDLARLREPGASAGLPEPERAAWKHLWAEVAALLGGTIGNRP